MPGHQFKPVDHSNILGRDNPYPEGHPRHQEWETFRREKVEQAEQLWADVLDMPHASDNDDIKLAVKWYGGVFDIRAEACVHFGPPGAVEQALIDEGERLLQELSSKKGVESPRLEAGLARVKRDLYTRHAKWIVSARTVGQVAARPADETNAPHEEGVGGLPSFASRTPARQEEACDGTGTFRRLRKGQWEVAFGGESPRVIPDQAGMEMVHRLIVAPKHKLSVESLLGREQVDCADPENLTRAERPARATETHVDSREPGVVPQGGQPVMDETAWQQCIAEEYRLEGEIEKAEQAGDTEKALILKEDLKRLQQERDRSTFRGRSREMGSPRRTATNTAQVAFRRCLEHLEKAQCLALIAHLRASIEYERGHYTYNPARPIAWRT